MVRGEQRAIQKEEPLPLGRATTLEKREITENATSPPGIRKRAWREKQLTSMVFPSHLTLMESEIIHELLWLFTHFR
jgi:hypothetical protein